MNDSYHGKRRHIMRWGTNGRQKWRSLCGFHNAWNLSDKPIAPRCKSCARIAESRGWIVDEQERD